jgi:hypothetical protein
MAKKPRHKRHDGPQIGDEVDALYHALLHAFYEDEDKQRARPIASRLVLLLANNPEVAESIRGQEIQSIIADLQGNLEEAIRHRRSEIGKIQALHRATWGTSAWDYAFRQYDYGDLSDRLDLLAILYADQGEWERAVETLEESRRFCEANNIEFDGRDLLEEFRHIADSREEGKPRTWRSVS